MNNNKNYNSLDSSETERISSRYIHGFDKTFRMWSGIGSRLERYEDDVLYLRIDNTEKYLPSNDVTALQFASNWKKHNEELENAKAFVVLFYKTKSTGFAVNVRNMADKPELINKLVQELNEAREQSDEVVSIASGLFARY
jgi:hypothetical protein